VRPERGAGADLDDALSVSLPRDIVHLSKEKYPSSLDLVRTTTMIDIHSSRSEASRVEHGEGFPEERFSTLEEKKDVRKTSPLLSAYRCNLSGL
jgi:hypothetical protein